jgi:hypothetical protein
MYIPIDGDAIKGINDKAMYIAIASDTKIVTMLKSSTSI